MVVASSGVTILLLLLCLSGSIEAAEYLVHPFPCHPGAPCQTLQDYVSNVSRYFTSNTTFVFLEDKHYLNSPVTLENITNIRFEGNAIEVSNIIVAPTAGFFFSDSSNIEFRSLRITNTGELMDVSSLALSFHYATSVLLSNIHFDHDNPGQSRSQAVEMSFTSAEIIDSTFRNGYQANGGALFSDGSILKFSGSTLFRNNTADYSGGGIYATNSSLHFEDSTSFVGNRAGTQYYPNNYDIGGGGIFASRTMISIVGYSEFLNNRPIHFFNNVLIGAAVLATLDSNVMVEGTAVFQNNSGYTGGALFLVNTTCSLQGQLSFNYNNATEQSGGAIFTHRSMVDIGSSAQFTGNYAEERGGGIYLEHSHMTSEGELRFVENVVKSGGGAVALLGSVMSIAETAHFVRNNAKYGGAIELLISSQIELISPVNVSFTRNRATLGGAILVSDLLSTYITQCQNVSVDRMNCFYKLQSPNASLEGVTLRFTENFVNKSGSSVYGGGLELCRVQINDIQSSMSGYQFLQNVSVVHLLPNDISNISSKPLRLCQCVNNMPNCSQNVHFNKTTVAGRTFNLSVMAVGQLDMPENANIVYIFNSSNGSEIQPQSYNSNDTIYCHNVGYKLITGNSNENLQVHPEGCNSYNGSLFMNIIVETCPPGFELVDKRCSCETSLLKIIEDEESCDIETGLIKRPDGLWIKPHFFNGSYKGFSWSKNCYLPYCVQENDADPTIMNFSSIDVDIQCQGNHTGIVCGSCEENHSLVLQQLNCDICEDRYLSLIVYFAFAGLALVGILLLLQLTVAKGTINGFILYSNFINICFDLFFPPNKAKLTPLSIFISWTNLNFGIPACFYDGLDAYSYIWLQYAFPFYLWFLIGAIIVACKESSKARSLFGSNPVAVLATIMLLSFTKLLETTVYVLSYRVLNRSDGAAVLHWWADANLLYFKGKHIPLAIFSLCVIIFILIPYTFFLLFGYRFLKYSGKKGFRWFNKFKPLLDAYYAPYTKRARFWPGLLILLRVCLFLSFTIEVINTSNGTLILASSLFIVVMTIAWTSGPIYNKLYNEVLEATFLLNICIVPIASYHVKSVNGNQLWVTYPSVAIAFSEFIGILLFHLLYRLAQISSIDKFRSRYFTRWDKYLEKKKVAKHPSKEEKHPMAVNLEKNIGVAIREPLLEDATTF